LKKEEKIIKMTAEEEADLLADPSPDLTVITPKENKFMAQGPRPIGSKKKYKVCICNCISIWYFHIIFSIN
jgi:hypothetical protein